MFLEFHIINTPFGWVMDLLYRLTTDYGLTLILFAIIVKLVMMPLSAKAKRSTMKMSRITPLVQKLQDKYKDDPAKQQQAIQELYKQEGTSMFGGCLWSFVPLLILLPLYQVVRQPLVHMLHLSAGDAETIVKIVTEQLPELFTEKNTYYAQMIAAAHMNEYADLIQAALPNVSQRVLEGLNFTFLGIDLSTVPDFSKFAFTWSWIGTLLIPVLSAGSQIISMLVSQKTNNSVITDENGVQDKETAEKSQANQSTKMMMYMMPIMSLWIGFTVPAALSLYWFIGGLVRMVEDTVLTKHYRKIYDAEDAIKLQKAMELDAIEAEKERIRAERRAANPEGQTQNTSKKKLQKQQRAEEEAAKAAAAREYAAKKGIVYEEEETESVMSGIPSRPYCKGRNYDPNRYSSDTTEE